MVLGTLVLLGGALASCSSSSVPGSSAPAAGVLPLISSSAGASASWATLPMGNLHDPFNTFWQLFELSAGTTQWTLSTPRGVASNGGLTASPGYPESVIVGFEASQNLHFSPLAASSDRGNDWVTGLLPAALTASPDALARSGGRSLALLGTGGTRVVGNTGDLVTWSPVVTRSDLAARTTRSACAVVGLTAVSFGAGGRPLVGGTCSSGSKPGIFASGMGTWRAVGPSLPGRPSGTSQVLRLQGTVAGLVALVRRNEGAASTLYAVSSANGLSGWTVSTGLRLAGGTLVSTGTTVSGGYVVVTRSAAGKVVASVESSPSGLWTNLPPLPDGTSCVVATPAGGFDTFIVDRSTLEVDSLGNGAWRRTQTMDVDIQYGSSD